MTEVHRPLSLSPENERSLRSLLRAIERTSGHQFALKLVRCNYHDLRDQVMQRLRQDCSVYIRELALSYSTPTLSVAIEAAFSKDELQNLPALSVQGLEQVSQLDSLLSAANQVRDSFHHRFPFPLVLWVTDDVQKSLIRIAPDFYNWASSPILFRPSPAKLIDFLTDQTHRFWQEQLKPNGDLFPRLSENIELSAFTLPHQEVEAAQRDLETDGHELTPELRASLQLILGRAQFIQDEIVQAIRHCQNSLAVWQSCNQADRVGVVYIHLGVCSWRQAECDRVHDIQHWQDAKQYFRAGLDAFKSGHRPDLNARFIGYLGETLKRLKQWDALQAVIEESLQLHLADSNRIDLAQDYGLKAELYLQRFKHNEAAQKYAQQALQLLDQTPHQPQERSGFLLLLAQAQYQLGQIEDAIAQLLAAREQISPSDDPHLYIAILEQLRALYFEQRDYRTAFEFKRQKIVIESQYGFRAFIGAGRLRQQSIKTSQGNHNGVSPEIAVSGRQKDVDRLQERIISNRHNLTIFHGPLGVGKSSILQAGLIPSLQHQRIETRRTISVLMRTYTDCKWAEKLGEKLSTQLRENLNDSIPPLQSADAILEQLHQNHQHNLVTVFIFDQFEEFFFNCKEISERQSFFSFLNQCLNLPFVNVILSLREDYLHYLLEWEKCGVTQITHKESDISIHQKNILSQEYRYKLGNFSSTDARNILQVLTERAQFYLEPELLDCLIQDLATINQDIKPIELQVIGFQLQAEGITTLEAYRALGENRKKVLVQNYLESVIEDCGSENQDTANLILYVLTDENNTRPSKTRNELETDLKALEQDLLKEGNQIDLVLYIFQKSGLVVLIPEIPSDRYQLVHDYLVSFIRAKQPIIEKMVAALKAQREEINRTQEQLKISELENELYRADKKSLKQNIELKEQRQKLLMVIASFLVVLAVVSSIFYLKIKKNYEYNKLLAMEMSISNKKRIVMLRLIHAEDLLQIDENMRRKVGILEVMIAADDLLTKLKGHDASDLERKKTIKLFKYAFNQILSIYDSSLMSSELHNHIEFLISQNHDKLSTNELNKSIDEWMKVSCQYAATGSEIMNLDYTKSLCDFEIHPK